MTPTMKEWNQRTFNDFWDNMVNLLRGRTWEETDDFAREFRLKCTNAMIFDNYIDAIQCINVYMLSELCFAIYPYEYDRVRYFQELQESLRDKFFGPASDPEAAVRMAYDRIKGVILDMNISCTECFNWETTNSSTIDLGQVLSIANNLAFQMVGGSFVAVKDSVFDLLTWQNSPCLKELMAVDFLIQLIKDYNSGLPLGSMLATDLLGYIQNKPSTFVSS